MHRTCTGRHVSLAFAAAWALLGGALPVDADQVSLTPARDNTLYESDQGLFSNGDGDFFFAGRTNQSDGQSIRRGLVAFDVSASIPAGSTIVSVTLTLFMSRSIAGPTDVSVHRALADWGEGSSHAAGQEGGGANAHPGDATWLHTFYDTNFWSSPGGDFQSASSATASVDSTGFYTWTGPGLVADVQFWLDNPAQDFGWVVIGDESQSPTAKRFNARQHSSSIYHPELTIDFTPPAVDGACCLPGDTCAVLSETDCLNMGGTYLGNGTDCAGDPCAPTTGACCFDDATCQELTEADCTATGGTYQGDGVMCTTELCPLVLEPFVDPLPIPAVAMPDSIEPGGVPRYDIEIVEFEQQLHRDLPPTRLWGYEGVFPGPTIEAETDQPILVNWINDLRGEDGQLRTEHYLPVELCLHGPNMFGNTPRVVTHLHGGHVPSEFDGQPEATILPGESVLYEYPNNQPAATTWYHDHALGITRLNVYMGLAGFYIIRDANENALNLPTGEYEIPIVIQDRSFNPDGTLKYPADWQEHFFGDFMVVNGRVTPHLDVDQGKYRLRLLNGCNARTLTLSLSNGASFDLIGIDGGLIETPQTVNEVTLASAERADVVIDFSSYASGTEIILENSAPAPFPGTPGVGVVPNVMKFIVSGDTGDTNPVPANLRTIESLNEVDASRSRDFELRKFPDACTGSKWLINELGWEDITEYVTLGDTEVWRFINRSGTMHPMHMHLVFFQVLDRQPFEIQGGEIVPIGSPTPPTATESGWKDTVQVGPFEIVRVIARFEDYTGLFPYHCHVLEHEDHEMMRQYMVVPPCPADFNDDRVVNVFDLLELLAGWGPCNDPDACPADLAGSGGGPDGAVNVFDLLELLANWGPCPE